MSETCRHCGEPKNVHAGPCRQELGVLYADARVEYEQQIAIRDLTIADLRNQHRQDEMRFGHLPHYHNEGMRHA